MSLINLSKANCKSCYKCVNSCKVKAIRMHNDQAEIVGYRCISCGHCLAVCPQHARTIKTDVDNIKKAIKNKKRVIASISRNFPAAFDLENPNKIVDALKKLGFSAVEDTGVGADAVIESYKNEIEKKKYENYITTNCPSVCYMIEQYFPSLIPYMLPIVSPMIAHGKIIKNKYGEDSYVVFIGSCIAKKREAVEKETKGYIDAVITFEELLEWMNEENINEEDLEPMEFEDKGSKESNGFPIVEGEFSNTISELKKEGYEFISVDGANRCIEIFKNLIKGEISKVCVEANVCKGGCIKGPGMPEDDVGFYKKRRKVKSYVKSNNVEEKKVEEKLISNIDFYREFRNKSTKRKKASEKEINEILKKMGKYEPKDELNCGGCGYNTCREKAQAVYEGMSEASLCLPYIISKVESLQNLIFQYSPDIILIIDEYMKIREINPRAEKTFGIKAEEIKGKHISVIMDEEDFKMVKNTKENVIKKKVFLPNNGFTMIVNILLVEKNDIMLVIMRNVSKEEKSKKELSIVKEKTLNAAQEVIEKQMRVAQKIASLLGETTAETKITLTKLKNVVKEESKNKL
ncbi:iron hydrogenase 1 [Clostridium acetireducens DSM 10703]|uniref:Iron hydrogenase 1 n=1 Tax=Clostridium acetireducens DSM 10703 TaxID=1121290 RepID=A0A1E8F1D3_9CLOT|nr:[Fe-Fe] hydrogenase large subunit C-terminal domain-containing protein [Clostridium acetireducens]OFI07256.1 iron hydrogenase 1 [Clostridium acetireducens DSM 10703]